MLEVTLKRSLLSPRFIQTGNGEPRKSHWLGNKAPAPSQPDQGQGGIRDNAPKQRDPRGYRDLASITLGEVRDAHQFFAKQLIPSPYPSWVGTNYFCMLDIQRSHEDHRPPVIFGRVKTCYPSDGYINNIQDMELYFPNKTGQPDTVLVRAEDILLQPDQPVQSYCIGIKFLASPEDTEDFKPYESLFAEKGFRPEFSSGYIDLLDLREADKDSYPWLYVIGSRWFASIPESVQPEIREGLKNLIRWNRLLFNYHPQSLPSEIRTLNRELGFKYGFTDIVLIEPEDPPSTLHILASSFEKIFQQPIR